MAHPENSIPDFTPLAEIYFQPLPKINRRADLDAIHCDCGASADNEPLSIVQKCHPGYGVQPIYFDGVLTLYCAVCDSVVNQIEVAK